LRFRLSTPDGTEGLAVPRLDYRECHLHVDAVQAYRDLYAAGYYAAQWRQLEQPLLSRLFLNLKENGSRTMLDIACGQGRIARLGAKYFERVHGFDISPAMLAQAKQSFGDDASLAVADVSFELGDVRTFTADQPFDVVTAFRFFLNAEDDLRLDGLRCARRNLMPGGTFIANVHVAATSPLAMFYGLSNTARRLLGKSSTAVRNSISVRQLRNLFASEGLRIDRVHRYSLLPRVGSLTDNFAERYLASVDRLGKLIPGVSLLSQAFVVCASPT
jgi:ubiquinone/menaquinone biosynthesis C-methylase UbiE